MVQKVFFVRIMVKLDVKLDSRMFIYSLLLKPLVWLALGHWYVFMCISVPMRYLEMVDKFWRKSYFYNPTHTITKLRFLETFSQKNFKNRKFKKKEKEKLLLWLKFQKRRNFWKSKAIDKFTPVNLLLEKYFCNFLLTWRFPYSKKRWFLALKNLNRLSI